MRDMHRVRGNGCFYLGFPELLHLRVMSFVAPDDPAVNRDLGEAEFARRFSQVINIYCLDPLIEPCPQFLGESVYPIVGSQSGKDASRFQGMDGELQKQMLG